MKAVEGKSENGLLTIFLSGNINSANAAEIEKEISSLIEKNSNDNIVIDAENLEYISSAGLRIILRLNNAHNELKLINASSSVYEIFEMTGFTEMMSVEKAYRKISIEGCEAIGQGANGIVYRIDDDTIIKVYRNPDSLPDIKRERELARNAFILGIPTAIPYDVVKVNDTYGSVFELLNAKSFAKLLNENQDDMDKYVASYVEILKQLHNTTVSSDTFTSLKDYALVWVNSIKNVLPQDKFNKLEKLFKEIPLNKTLIHGDYHIKNIMMQNDEVLLIDMDTLSYGNPVLEFAQIYLAHVGFGEFKAEDLTDFLNVPQDVVHRFWDKTLSTYFSNCNDEEIKQIENKIKVVGYTRIVRRIYERENNPEKLEFYKNKLLLALDSIESLGL